ncbi:hypothetical protein E1218_20445 [Kribbella turkmenica]|uniref:Uncharacterized protein n=1 Tax=Kribbella turkmenica TaxID=2530375 RepID=A0A4R4WVG5_9ACTN|nr:hypothetical protein [Kribbella turkmenica]TDD21783.1 hypothetical protein E1218_20445 [Kribbella turkmenica]
MNDVLSFRRYFATLEPGEIRQAELMRLLPWAFALELDNRWEQLASSQDVVDDEPVPWWSVTGMFRLGPFRRGLAAFADDATLRSMQDTKYWHGADGTADDVPPFDFGSHFSSDGDSNH